MDVAANVVALIQAAHKLYEITHDIYHAREEQSDILKSIQGILDVLKQIEVRQNDAAKNPTDPWYQGLLALSASAAKTTNGKALVPDPTRQGDGALVRLKKAVDLLTQDLTRKHGFQGFKQRWMWTHNKKKIKELIANLDQLRGQVDSVLLQDQFQLTKAIIDLTKDILATETDINDRVKGLQQTGAETVNHLQELQTQSADHAGRMSGLVQSTTNIETSAQRMNVATDDTNKRIRRLEAANANAALQEERRAIVEWLSPLQYRRRQSEIFNGAIPMGQNFLGSEEFRAWSTGRPWILYGYGQPGSGKTVLCSIVVDQLRHSLASFGVPVLCMYLNYKEPNQTLTNLVGSLLKQLIQYQDDNFKSARVRRLFREAAREASPLLDDLYAALLAEIKTFPRVVLVVDALDELSFSVESELYDRLRSLLKAGMSIMITSRPRDEIGSQQVACNNCGKSPLKLYHSCFICDENGFDLCQSCVDKGVHCLVEGHHLEEPPEVSINIVPTDEEIKRYIEHELSKELKLGSGATRDRRLTSSRRGTTRLGRICQVMPELEALIPQYILARCNGMLMLAKLFLGAIKAKTSPEEVKNALETLPRGYEEIYRATMERIEAASLFNPNDTSSSLAKRTLMWIACSFRPLSLKELQEALSISLETPDFRPSSRYDKETLLEITAGLVYVDSDEKNVWLHHATAQEYFDQTRETWFPNAASQITRYCMQYLERPELTEPCDSAHEDDNLENRSIQHPLFGYACSFWGTHARDAMHDEDIQGATVRYLEDTRKVDAFMQAAWYLNSNGSENWDIRKGASSLHVAAWFGLAKIIPGLLRRGLDVNSLDPVGGQTPLMLACRRGHASVVAIFLEEGATVNARNNAENTALFEAVYENHPEAVAILLKKPELNVNEEHLHNAERTPLMFAVRDGYADIVSQLLEDPRIDVNKKALDGTTALSIAAKTGSSISVRFLLEHDSIDLDAVDHNGSSALIHAAIWDHSEIVKQLLSAGANSKIKDHNGGTALLRAIDNGNTAVVKIMLEHSNMDIIQVDKLGRTLLHGAAMTGRAEIAELLIMKGLDPNAQDTNGRTPLHEASRTGEAEIVRLLLAMGANRTIQDQWRRSPWDVAWTNGKAKVMLMLEEKPADEASIQMLLNNYPNTNGLSIWSLTTLGSIDLLTSALRDRPSSLFYLDPDTDNTALHAAVLANNNLILRTLLHAGLSPDSRNMQARTPLHLAVLLKSLACTRILLANSPSPDLNIFDEFRQTPLLIAQINAEYEIAFALIEAGAHIDPEIIQVQALFFAAVEFGKAKAVTKLIEAGAMVGEKNVAGKTALRLAKEGQVGMEEEMGEVIRVLRANKSWVVSRRENGIGLVEPETDEERAKDNNKAFQMSTFRRKDIFDEDDETAKILGAGQGEELDVLNKPKAIPA
ncbi:MAG: hypothetical protein Q9200_005497 [Gallowayella weberi]